MQIVRSYSGSNEKILKVAINQITPTASIKLLNFNYNLKIKPNDILDPSDANTLRATLISADGRHCGPEPILLVDLNENTVNIKSGPDNLDKKLTCILEVPVKSNLQIESTYNVHVEKLYSDEINVLTSANISTHNLQGFSFDFESTAGNIQCTGNTLAHQIKARVRGDGVRYWFFVFK